MIWELLITFAKSCQPTLFHQDITQVSFSPWNLTQSFCLLWKHSVPTYIQYIYNTLLGCFLIIMLDIKHFPQKPLKMFFFSSFIWYVDCTTAHLEPSYWQIVYVCVCTKRLPCTWFGTCRSKRERQKTFCKDEMTWEKLHKRNILGIQEKKMHSSFWLEYKFPEVGKRDLRHIINSLDYQVVSRIYFLWRNFYTLY